MTGWRFLEDFPLTETDRPPLAARRQQLGDAFLLPYLISKLGDLELELADLESSAATVEDYLALDRLIARRNDLAEAADEVIFRRGAAVGRT